MSLLKFLLIVGGFWIAQYGMAQADPPSIPELSRWESQMIEYGTKWCDLIKNPSVDWALRADATYYDGERVYYQIADYTGDRRWLDCAQASERLYRDDYLFPNNGAVAGWNLFPHGLWIDYTRTKDEASRTAVGLLANNAAFATDNYTLGSLSDPFLSREVAYNIQAKLLARDLGSGNLDAGITRLVEEAFRHMDAWFISKTYPYVRPFMVALTSEALILYHSKTGDARVLPMLKIAWDYIWDNCWLPNNEALTYTDRQSNDNSGGREPAPDLNMLIAPVFGWLYAKTGNPIYAQRGDAIFAGGVKYAYLNSGKQFNQSYRWSFAYVAWRQGKSDVMGSGGGAVEGHYRFKQSPPSQPESSAPTGHFRFKK
jgi:hypothetical protein